MRRENNKIGGIGDAIEMEMKMKKRRRKRVKRMIATVIHVQAFERRRERTKRMIKIGAGDLQYFERRRQFIQ